MGEGGVGREVGRDVRGGEERGDVDEGLRRGRRGKGARFKGKRRGAVAFVTFGGGEEIWRELVACPCRTIQELYLVRFY